MTKNLLPVFCATLMIVATPLLASDYQLEREAILEREAAIGKNKDRQSATERLNSFIDLYFDYTMLEFPEFATFIGHPTGHDRWTDNSLDAIQRREEDTRRALKHLKGIKRGDLTGQDRLNYDLFLNLLQEDVAGSKFNGEYLAISQLGGVQQDVAQMLAMMPATNIEQYENTLARLAAVPEQIEQTRALLDLGLKTRTTPPRITLRDVPQQVLNIVTDDPLESALLRSFTNFPDNIDAATQTRLRDKAVALFENQVGPAFLELHAYLVDEYLPGARESIAMKDLPDGGAWYAFNVKQMTTTDLSPDEIHEIGLSEVARLRGEMDKVIKETGFEGGFKAFTEFLRTDEQFYFDDPDQLIMAYRDIAKRADAATVKVIGKLPRLPYGVVKVPEYAEQSQTTAYYRPGSLEAGRPGEFFANTYNLKSRPIWEMEALTLHEAVPGHHLQIAIQQELEDVAWFRRYGGYTAYMEGWGLYAESLGPEMGFYEDPYSKFGQLTYEMWRAVRLVVDTGMHSRGWSRERAIEFFIENTGKAEHDIVVEIDRYIVWPGQALAYKIGELAIKKLRAKATDKLGEQFDVRNFHDAILGSGALPLGVLEIQIDEWIAEQLNSQSE